MVQDTPSARLSILHVAQPQEGGVARCVLTLASDQLARGWDVAVATHSAGALGRSASAAGARLIPWKAERALRHVPRETTSLQQALSHEQPDVVHLHSSKAGLVGRTLVRRRVPTVFQPHGWSFEPLHGPLRRAAIAWERRAARWADAIICVSYGEQERGVRAGIKGPWAIAHNGVDVVALSEATADERRAARERLGLDAGPLVVCVGRLCRAKGQDVLVDAWPLVLSHVPRAELVLVGDGPDLERFRATTGSQIQIVGARSDVPEWLAAADVVAAPSRWEGMSFAMLEALARGRSIVMSDVPGARDAIGPDAGTIVPVENTERLAYALIERLIDPERAAAEGRAGRVAAEKFTIQAANNRIAEVYARVLLGHALARRTNGKRSQPDGAEVSDTPNRLNG